MIRFALLAVRQRIDGRTPVGKLTLLGTPDQTYRSVLKFAVRELNVQQRLLQVPEIRCKWSEEDEVSQPENWKRFITFRVWMLLVLMFLLQASATSQLTRAEYNAKRIKILIDELKKELEIDKEIEAIIVPKNEMIVSVQPVRERKGVYEISFEENFLNTLDDNELRAVIAHELGHVWIFTHHPYLQTEDLANSIAFKAVTQESLDRVYDKVRTRNIVAGTLSATLH